MIRLERRRGDIVRATKIALRLCRLLRYLTDDSQIVQRVGKIRMERAEAGFLQPGRFAEQLFGCREVTARGSLLRRFEDGARFALIRHCVSDGTPVTTVSPLYAER